MVEAMAVGTEVATAVETVEVARAVAATVEVRAVVAMVVAARAVATAAAVTEAGLEAVARVVVKEAAAMAAAVTEAATAAAAMEAEVMEAGSVGFGIVYRSLCNRCRTHTRRTPTQARRHRTLHQMLGRTRCMCCAPGT